MTDRVSRIVLLCEDDAQQRLAFAYMKHCGINTKYDVVRLVGSRRQQGSAKQWVIRQFPEQLHACRQRSARARTQLVVFVDADEDSVEHREQQLWRGVSDDGSATRLEGDAVVLLIPRWHVETWIKARLGETVSEDEPCKGRKEPYDEDLKQAARRLFEWSRDGARPGPTCVASLERSLPEWRKIGCDGRAHSRPD